MCERRYYSSNVSSDICRLTNVPLLPCSCFINVRDVSLAPQSLVQCFVQQYYFLKLHEWVSYPRGACIYVSVLIILHFSPLLWYGRTYSVVRSEVAQSCVTLCNLMDCSLPGSSVHGIFQARVLEWVAFPSPEELPDLGIEPGLQHGRQMLYPLSHQGSAYFVVGTEEKVKSIICYT